MSGTVSVSGLLADGHLQIDVLSGGGGTEYSEGVATPGTIAGLSTMMERDDALGGLTPAEGEWASLRCDANGALWTHDDALDAAISGSEMQVDIVADGAGLATAANQLADGHNVTIDNTDSNEVYVRGSGTAGSADAKVLTVQGIASGTALAVTESSPISGFATSANQSTIIGHVDGVETLLGTIDSDTDATKTATEASQAALEKMLYGNALVITAVHGGDTQALGATYESLYVGVGGDVVVTMVGTGNFTFKNLASGQLLPIRFTHVINTNTTATYMIALKA